MDFSSYVHQYYKSGYLVYQESGEAGKVCADHMNKTIPTDEVGRVLNKLGESMCSLVSCPSYVSYLTFACFCALTIDLPKICSVNLSSLFVLLSQ